MAGRKGDMPAAIILQACAENTVIAAMTSHTIKPFKLSLDQRAV